MTTLDQFVNSSIIPNSCPVHTVKVGPDPIRNFALVRQLVAEAFSKDPERVALLLDSNGSMERPATEWRLRRVVN